MSFWAPIQEFLSSLTNAINTVQFPSFRVFFFPHPAFKKDVIIGRLFNIQLLNADQLEGMMWNIWSEMAAISTKQHLRYTT